MAFFSELSGGAKVIILSEGWPLTSALTCLSLECLCQHHDVCSLVLDRQYILEFIGVQFSNIFRDLAEECYLPFHAPDSSPLLTHA